MAAEAEPEMEPFGNLSRSQEFEAIMEQRLGGLADVECDMLLGAIATVLDNVVSRNEADMCDEDENETSSSGRNSMYHGLRAPLITLNRYLNRIFKYAGASPACYVLAFVYMDRILQGDPSLRLCSRSVHRLLIVCVLVAAKFLDDHFYNNAYYAKVGGISTEELNALEVETLQRIDWRLFVSPDDFEHTVNFLLPPSEEHQQPSASALEEQPVPSGDDPSPVLQKPPAAVAPAEPALPRCGPSERASRSALATPEPAGGSPELGPGTPTTAEQPPTSGGWLQPALPAKRRRSSTRCPAEHRKQVPAKCLRVRHSPRAPFQPFKAHHHPHLHTQHHPSHAAACLRGRRARLSAPRHPFIGIDLAWGDLQVSLPPRSRSAGSFPISGSASPGLGGSPPPAAPACASAPRPASSAWAPRHRPEERDGDGSDSECGCGGSGCAGELYPRDEPAGRLCGLAAVAAAAAATSASSSSSAAAAAGGGPSLRFVPPELELLASLSIAPGPPASERPAGASGDGTHGGAFVRPPRFTNLSALSDPGPSGREPLPEWRAHRASHFLCPSPPVAVTEADAAHDHGRSTFSHDGELPERLARLCHARPAPPAAAEPPPPGPAPAGPEGPAGDLAPLRSAAREMRESGRAFDDPAVLELARSALRRARSARGDKGRGDPGCSGGDGEGDAPAAELAAALSAVLRQLAGDATGSRENHELLLLVIDLLAIARCLAEAAPSHAAAAVTATAAAAAGQAAWAGAQPAACGGTCLRVAAC